MQEHLDALAGRIRDLVSLVHQLRDENQTLRTELAGAQTEVNALQKRVTGAVHRIDRLLERLPAEPVTSVPDAHSAVTSPAKQLLG